MDISRSLSIFQLDQELQSLMESAQQQEADSGSVTPETMEALKSYFSATVEKVDRIAEFLKMQDVLDKAKKEEKARLDERARISANSVARCKAMLKEFMDNRGITQIKGRLNTITLADTGIPKLNIHNDALVPDEFRIVQISVKLPAWNRSLESYKQSESGTIDAGELFRSVTGALVTSLDEKAIRAMLANGQVPGAELIYSKHIRVR